MKCQRFRPKWQARPDFHALAFPEHMISDIVTLRLPALQQYADRIVRLPAAVETSPSYVAFPKKRGLIELRERFDAQFRQFMTSAAYRRLLEKCQINEPSRQAYLQPAPEGRKSSFLHTTPFFASRYRRFSEFREMKKMLRNHPQHPGCGKSAAG
jgi:hypothetical protein